MINHVQCQDATSDFSLGYAGECKVIRRSGRRRKDEIRRTDCTELRVIASERYHASGITLFFIFFSRSKLHLFHKLYEIVINRFCVKLQLITCHTSELWRVSAELSQRTGRVSFFDINTVPSRPNDSLQCV